MRRGLWIAGGILGVGAIALAVFLIPTLRGRPWSIEHFYARVFLEHLLEHPMLLSQLRILEPYGIDFHSDELDDFSVGFRREEWERARRNLGILRSYDRATQSAAERLSMDVLEWYLAIQVDGEPFLFHDYPLNQLWGVQSTLPDFMANVHQVNDAGDAQDYVARLSRFGTALDQALDGVRYRAARGVLPPRFVLERVRAEVEALIAVPPEENVLQRHLTERLAELPEIPERERAALLEAARAAVTETVYPAYRRVAAALPAWIEAAGTDDGAWHLPDGDAYYAFSLRLHTTTDLGPDAIHALGLAEVERIHREMRRILEAEGLAGGELAPTLRALHRDPRFLYPESDEGRARILADYQAIIDDVGARLPAYFGRLPRAPVVVERVPEFKQDGAPGAYYRPPPLDGSRPGVFYANLRSVGETPRFGMRTLAVHEAIPGHHLQIAIAQELPDVPFFRRVIPFTAFVEGWALYAERLAAEEGFHPTALDHLGQLVAEVFRAVRLVVDTGIHARRWTREQAIDYMLANTGMSETDVVAEVERYIVDPGQACAYKVGQLRLLGLRERARAALGERFDYRAFHDRVLGSGALPMPLLERNLEEWLAESP